ncbi:acetyltransferase [Sodiomyces alkalinus F11]|uniref:Acetyltransferase n=1 Tax=Sodiomyces alkalinus (strain CBS 110278 / VKM F-3762 / F11) TaxID=1314773 RepID=A0A3N2PTM3_SODAK|nr:acetyltransferase [Sodiomyces alkalinus F11]ROT37852.1 acetyltransferase [Sodiomyces alkalinus F11]
MAAQSTIRHARREDVPAILSFLKAGAAEQAPGTEIPATEARIAATFHFDPPSSHPHDPSSPPPPTPSPTPPATAPTPQSNGHSSPPPLPPFVRALLIIAPETGQPAGHAIYYYNYSTWIARPGIHLEELYVVPEYRRRGYAKLLIDALAAEAARAGCVKLDWVCLRDNERALRFYDGLGVERMENWMVLKADEEGIARLAAGSRRGG